MTKTLRLLFATLGCVVFSAGSFAGGPFGIIDVGRWQGAAYTNDKAHFPIALPRLNFRTAVLSFSRMPIIRG